MKNQFFRQLSFGLWLVLATGALPAVAQERDSLQLEELVVIGTRPNSHTPITKQRLSVEQLRQHSTAWDVPTLLLGTPSVVATNESGVQGGYTFFSVRGVDPSRVNITLNGIPLNDSESQQVFWANMPDLVSRLEDIVVVRGAGSSSFGVGAFGATMDMRIAPPRSEAGGEVAWYGGSYGLDKKMVALQSGALASGWSLAGYLSRTSSRGYVARSGGTGVAAMLQAHYQGDNYTLQLLHNSGKQQTGIAWNGISEGEMEKYGRNFNSAGWVNPAEPDATKHQFYPNTDNYRQHHTFVSFRHHPLPSFTYEVTLHHTLGYGFTHEYRTGRRYREYGLVEASNKMKADLIREKYLDNQQWGGVANLRWCGQKLTLQGGVSGSLYWSAHFGTLPYVKESSIEYTPGQEYYRNYSKRAEAALYLRAEWEPVQSITAFADVMYRYLWATMQGPSDRWDSYKGALDVLDYRLPYHFLLPKVGVSWRPIGQGELYLSVATAGKEPNRKMYTESKRYTAQGELVMPSPEYMLNVELGSNWRWRTLQLHLNWYGMYYHNQLVPNGAMSDVGEALLVNVPKSYRTGVEVGLEWHLTPQLAVGGNATLSQSVISEYTLQEWHHTHNQVVEYQLSAAPIAKSPRLIANHRISWRPWQGVSLALSGNYVGRQYLDNSGLEARSLPAYYTAQLMASYEHRFAGGNRLALQLQVLNLFNARYATNGWVYGYTDEEQGHTVRKQEVGYFPAAPTHLVVGATWSF